LKRGIDVSTFQGTIDFNKVAKDPFGQFAILRAGYGRYAKQEDPRFKSYYNGAKAAGIPVGIYWYSYAMTPDEARLEANACAQVLGDRKLEYPVAFDMEDPKQMSLTKEQFSAVINAFCDEMEKKGYYVVLYGNPNTLKYYTLQSTIDRYDIWIANWYVKKPAFSCNYGIWQIGSTKMIVGTEAVSGVSCECDLDFCYCDYPAIMIRKHLNGY